MTAAHISMPLGIVIRKSPGVTKWARWTWRVVAVLPGASQECWKELRREGEAVEYHAATVDLVLWRAEVEAYLSGLSTRVPSIYVVLQDEPDGVQDIDVLLATASPYEAQDYADSGEEIVEQVPMPDGLIAWVRDYVNAHHEDEVFVKRERDKKKVDLSEDGKGDARIPQLSDVFTSPKLKREAMH